MTTTNDIVPLDTVRTAAATLGDKVSVTETSLAIDDDLDFEAWAELGGRLGVLASSSQFWIGDWLVEGESIYGKKHELALQVTGLDPETLRKYRWVAERVDAVLRRTALGFHHHVLVAALEPSEQAHWLKVAIEEQLTVAALREAIGASRQLPASTPPAWKEKLAQLFDGRTEPVPVDEVRSVVKAVLGVAARYIPEDQRESFYASLDLGREAA